MKKNKLLLVLFSISLLFTVSCVNKILVRSEKGDLVGLKKIEIKDKEEVNVTSIYGWSPLMFAARDGNVEMAEYLIEMGADVNLNYYKFEEPGNNVSLIKNVASTPLHIACLHDQLDVEKLLLKNGADTNARNIVGFTPIDVACKKNHFQSAKLLVEEGADVNIQTVNGLTPLMRLLKKHDSTEKEIGDFAKYLVTKGANVNIMSGKRWRPTGTPPKYVNTFYTLGSYSAGWTPLMLAVSKGYTDIAKLLIDSGADITPKPDDSFSTYYCSCWTPLTVAAAYGHQEITGMLLDNGADINSKTKDLRTPLHIAARMDKVDTADYLIGKGAEVYDFGSVGEDSHATAVTYKLSAESLDKEEDKQMVVDNYKLANKYFKKAHIQFNKVSEKISKQITQTRVANVITFVANVAVAAVQTYYGTGGSYGNNMQFMSTASLKELKKQYTELSEKNLQSSVEVESILKGF